MLRNAPQEITGHVEGDLRGHKREKKHSLGGGSSESQENIQVVRKILGESSGRAKDLSQLVLPPLVRAFCPNQLGRGRMGEEGKYAEEGSRGVSKEAMPFKRVSLPPGNNDK